MGGTENRTKCGGASSYDVLEYVLLGFFWISRWSAVTSFREEHMRAMVVGVGIIAVAGVTYASRASAARCDPAYPTVCIPPAPPDLDCPEIQYRDFVVYPPDPHHFDGDKDGVGCET